MFVNKFERVLEEPVDSEFPQGGVGGGDVAGPPPPASLGKDVTSPKILKQGFRIFRLDGKYSVVDAETQIQLNRMPLARGEVLSFIKQYKE
jgi:hypothetical protein